MQTYRFSITWEAEFVGKELSAWTAPANLRCGDLILLYEGVSEGGRGAFVAVGRAVTDAVRSSKGDKGFWAWLEWRAAKTPLPLARAKKLAKFSVMGSHGRIGEAEFRRLSRAITASDAAAQKALAGWRDGRGFPTTDQVPLRDLVLASMGPTYEWHSYPAITDALLEEGWRQLPDEVDARIRPLRGDLAFDRGVIRTLQPDITLCRPRAKRLLVVEAKRIAVPTNGYRNPVDQVMDYSRACRKALPQDWTVHPLLVAEEYSDRVIAEAETTRLQARTDRPACRVWDGRKLGPDLVRDSA